ncbi:hypothetical protein Adt_19571 [Abeliophyllum distichum]|uniref:Uncharacterized protein n=1 Tax=Abeliophyllum distichum TaxID=126358 RepID=A0ABD1STB7_9LAMI
MVMIARLSGFIQRKNDIDCEIVWVFLCSDGDDCTLPFFPVIPPVVLEEKKFLGVDSATANLSLRLVRTHLQRPISVHILSPRPQPSPPHSVSVVRPSHFATALPSHSTHLSPFATVQSQSAASALRDCTAQSQRLRHRTQSRTPTSPPPRTPTSPLHSVATAPHSVRV